MRNFLAGVVAGGVGMAGYAWLARRRRLRPDVPFKEGKYGLGTHASTKGGPITIRLATKADVATIHKLIIGLAAYEDEPPSTVEVTESDLVAHGFGPVPLFHCLLAETESGEAAGFALVYNSYSTWQGPCIYLEDLYVDKAHRGRGVGGLLLKSVAALAYSRSCKRVHWNALDWNTPALEFYDSIGAKVMKEWLTLRLYRPQMADLLELQQP